MLKTKPTREQLRAGRALLNWSRQKLAMESGVEISILEKIERRDGRVPGFGQTEEAVRATLEAAGIRFLSDGDASIGPGASLVKS